MNGLLHGGVASRAMTITINRTAFMKKGKRNHFLFQNMPRPAKRGLLGLLGPVLVLLASCATSAPTMPSIRNNILSFNLDPLKGLTAPLPHTPNNYKQAYINDGRVHTAASRYRTDRMSEFVKTDENNSVTEVVKYWASYLPPKKGSIVVKPPSVEDGLTFLEDTVVINGYYCDRLIAFGWIGCNPNWQLDDCRINNPMLICMVKPKNYMPLNGHMFSLIYMRSVRSFGTDVSTYDADWKMESMGEAERIVLKQFTDDVLELTENIKPYKHHYRAGNDREVKVVEGGALLGAEAGRPESDSEKKSEPVADPVPTAAPVVAEPEKKIVETKLTEVPKKNEPIAGREGEPRVEQVTVSEVKETRAVPDLTNSAPDLDSDSRYYALQVASFHERKNAESFSTDLIFDGWSAKIVEVDLGEKGKWYRICLGKYEDMDQAQKASNDLIQRKLFDVAKPIEVN